MPCIQKSKSTELDLKNRFSKFEMKRYLKASVIKTFND